MSMDEDRPGRPVSRRDATAGDALDPAPEMPQPDDPAGGALLAALDEYRSGMKDLHEAADEAGVGSWDLLEALQATPDPIARSNNESSRELQTFVRDRDE